MPLTSGSTCRQVLTDPACCCRRKYKSCCRSKISPESASWEGSWWKTNAHSVHLVLIVTPILSLFEKLSHCNSCSILDNYCPVRFLRWWELSSDCCSVLMQRVTAIQKLNLHCCCCRSSMPSGRQTLENPGQQLDQVFWPVRQIVTLWPC